MNHFDRSTRWVIWWMLSAASLVTVSAAQQTFEVASIRPSDRKTIHSLPRMGPLVFSIRASLKELIAVAYRVERYQIIGGPTWIDSNWYDVQAKAESPASTDQIRDMLASLLADRFQLRLHRASQNMNTYILTVGQSGSKLKEAAAETPRDGPGAIMVGRTDVTARGATASLIARFLTGQLGEPVLDRTGLDGHYDFQIRFDPIQDGNSSGLQFGSIFSALGDLGLKLESKKNVPVPVLIIDSAQPPSPN
ncbi:MAG TPA: TIGR03435 family protein [Bryobacteraceae bacterium]|nr:TIGR03435 family protein [Bryobacteraceae bacterium]